MCKDFACIHAAFMFSMDSDVPVLTCQFHRIMIFDTQICKQCERAACYSCIIKGGDACEGAGKGNADGLHPQTAI